MCDVIFSGASLTDVLWSTMFLSHLLTTRDNRRRALFSGLGSALFRLLLRLGLLLLFDFGLALSLFFTFSLSLSVRSQREDGYRQNDRLNPASLGHC